MLRGAGLKFLCGDWAILQSPTPKVPWACWETLEISVEFLGWGRDWDGEGEDVGGGEGGGGTGMRWVCKLRSEVVQGCVVAASRGEALWPAMSCQLAG